MKKYYRFIITIWLLGILFSCNENVTNKHPIVLGDSNYIITEKDSQYLQNFTEDIEPNKHKTSANQITKMMVQVDSLKTAKKIEEETPKYKPLQGFTIHFEQFDVLFESVSAHAISTNQNERATNSVSYVMDLGNLLETQIEIDGIENAKVEQRISVKLAAQQNDETYILNDLGKYTTPWYPLAGKNNIFVSVGTNSLQFTSTTHEQIQNALDRELRKKKKSKIEISKWMNLIKNTTSHQDAPCTFLPVSAQWKITGTYQGKPIKKLIQFDKAH